MKTCPTCGQEIQEAAIRCRHCKNWLVAPGAVSAAYATAGNPYPTTTTNGMAIASMVLGIVWIYWIGSIVGLILGYLALREIRKDPQRMEGKGMAIAGIVLGWIGVVVLVLAIALGIYIWKTDRHERPEDVRAATAIPQEVCSVGRRRG